MSIYACYVAILDWMLEANFNKAQPVPFAYSHGEESELRALETRLLRWRYAAFRVTEKKTP